MSINVKYTFSEKKNPKHLEMKAIIIPAMLLQNFECCKATLA